MKKFKSIFAVLALATMFAMMLTSCFGWYDYDPYGPPPPPPPHHGTNNSIKLVSNTNYLTFIRNFLFN